MILVTGAGGMVGCEVVRQLASANVPFRALYSSKAKIDAARARKISAMLVDYQRPPTLQAAFKGVDRLFLHVPSHLHQTEQELNVLEAAKGADVRHIVKLSVWRAPEEAHALARIHRPVERAIEASGLTWTILRPNAFMQDLLARSGSSIRADSTICSSAGSARVSLVDVRDVVAVAIKTLTGRRHAGKVYALSGPAALTYDEMAAELSDLLGRCIRYLNLTAPEMKQRLLVSGLPEYALDGLIELERYQLQNQASEVTTHVRRLLRRTPIRFARFARDYASVLHPV